MKFKTHHFSKIISDFCPEALRERRFHDPRLRRHVHFRWRQWNPPHFQQVNTVEDKAQTVMKSLVGYSVFPANKYADDLYILFF